MQICFCKCTPSQAVIHVNNDLTVPESRLILLQLLSPSSPQPELMLSPAAMHACPAQCSVLAHWSRCYRSSVEHSTELEADDVRCRQAPVPLPVMAINMSTQACAHVVGEPTNHL